MANNIQVKEFEIILEGKKYKFRLDFEALIKFDERYENGIQLFNEFLQGKNVYSTVVKILSCACNKKITEEELAKKLGFSFGSMKFVDDVTNSLLEGLLVESEKTEAIEDDEKN